jgi:transcriptional regulator with XRE-family HTH domain
LAVTDDESVGLVCRRLRRQSGLSQRALARKAGVAAATIARIETGATDPTVGTLVRLATAAGARVEVTGLDATPFVFGITETKRDRGGRRPPPHRLSDSGLGWWDTSLGPVIGAAILRHQADLTLLMSVAAARTTEARATAARAAADGANGQAGDGQ